MFFLFDSFLFWVRRLTPISKNTIPESNLSKKAGMRFEIDPPAKAPSRVAIIKAIDDPMKTASGLLVVLLNVIVVS